MAGSPRLPNLLCCIPDFVVQPAVPRCRSRHGQDSPSILPALTPSTIPFPSRPDGHATYECSAKISPDSDERETYQSEFIFSDATRVRIFDLAAQAHYFSGKVDSGNRKLANTGTKRLVYTDGKRNNTAEFNFSPSQSIQQLTAIFQGASATLEYGRRLVHLHRYQKLALDEELKSMEDQARRGEIAELQVVKPVLQQIYDDSSVMNVVRARALRIMEMGNATKAGP